MDKRNLGRVTLSLLVSGALASADTLVLRNGTRIDGSFLGGDNHTIQFAAADRVNRYNLVDVESVRFTGNNSASAAPAAYAPPAPAQQVPPQQPYPQQPYNNEPAYNAGPNGGSPSYNAGNQPYNGNQPSNNASLQVPAGTELTVRMIDPVDSELDRLGQTYRASLDQPVVVNGQTVIPRGADVVATLIDAQKSGKIQGRTSLTIDLKTVTVNGRQYDITTTGVSQESSSRGARSAKVIGGTAAVGAIIGAIAGGGRGAAIGAGSGAAVGTAAQVMTSGQKVKVPSETRLSFTLQNPVNL